MEVLRAKNIKSSHGFYTSHWGDCGVATGSVANRNRVADDLKIRHDDLISCYQIHSPDVITVTASWPMDESRPKADAMVTNQKGIALGIITADCVPLLFVDSKAGVIGAAHAGWRGAVSGVIENTIAAMEKLGAHRKAMDVALGPCIWQNSYEVGPEFPAPFLAENPDHQKFFRAAFKSDHYLFNLPGYIEAKLRALGLVSIESSPADTLPDEGRFFSYRRSTLRGEKRAGSLISVIVLTE
ncbi:MAG: peptidoglycan editing factor PgeF [Alphaproteobacteria bacterium]